MPWRCVHLGTGILERDGCILLVANRYPNLPTTVWTLPGGRQEQPEPLEVTVAREFIEETSLHVRIAELAYVVESYDHHTHTHFINFAFAVSGDGYPSVSGDDRHTVACDWVARADIATRLTVDVVRLPLLAYLADPQRRYFAYAHAGITIEFND